MKITDNNTTQSSLDYTSLFKEGESELTEEGKLALAMKGIASQLIKWESLPKELKFNLAILKKVIEINPRELESYDLNKGKEPLFSLIKENHNLFESLPNSLKRNNELKTFRDKIELIDLEKKYNLSLLNKPREFYKKIKDGGGLELYFLNLSAEIKNDLDVMKGLVGISGRSIKWVSPDLKDNEEIVRESLKANYLPFGDTLKGNESPRLQYASRRIQGIEEIVIEAVKRDQGSFKFASNELKTSKEFVLKIVKFNGCSLEHAPKFQNDKEITDAARAQDPESLRYCSNEIATQAINEDKNNLRYCSKEIALEFVKRDQTNLQYCSREVVTEFLSKDPMYLKFCSEDFRSDREIVTIAFERNVESYKYASEKIRDDEEEAKYFLNINPHSLKNLLKLRDNRAIVLYAVSIDGASLKYAGDNCRGDKDIIIKAINNDPNSIQYAPIEMQSDDEVLKALQEKKNNFQEN